MKRKFKYYLVNKIFAIVIFVIFYLFVVYLQEINNKYLPFNIWEQNTVALIINLIFGGIIGWFLFDDIKFRLNRYQNIATICILILLSLYQYFYFFPICVDYLSPNLFKATKYPQLILGMYLIFYLQRIFKSRKLKKKEVISIRKEFEFQGCVEVPAELSEDEFLDKFIAFIEENGWLFGGGINTIIDGFYINADGTKGKYVLDE